jgi:asparaginyl-tRNA synthetase
MRRTTIDRILAEGTPGQALLVQGWIRTLRASKNVSFIALNDGSCLENLQVVFDQGLPNYAELDKLGTGASVVAEGALVESPGKGQRVELKATRIDVIGDAPVESYPLQKKGTSLEFLRSIAHLRARTNTFGAVFRLRNALAHAIHSFFQERGFLWVHTPVVSSSDCEGAGEMFQVTTLDLDKPPRTPAGALDFAQDFFGRPTYLTVSGQLEAELLAMGLGDVYTFGPTFRAENSNTRRHMAEFWMVEPEMAFADLDDDVQLAEDFLKYIIARCLDRCPADLAFLEKHYQPGLRAALEAVANAPFVRMSYTEAVDALQKSGETFEFPVSWGIDLQAEHERYLTEKKVGGPVIVTDYPKAIKAFYMRVNDDGRTVAAMDVLSPGIGEIIGGSQREERLDVLEARIKEMGLPLEAYSWYLDLRRFGTVKHAGFGLGFDRMLQYVSGMENIRDVIPFPRTPGNAEF